VLLTRKHPESANLRQGWSKSSPKSFGDRWSRTWYG